MAILFFATSINAQDKTRLLNCRTMAGDHFFILTPKSLQQDTVYWMGMGNICVARYDHPEKLTEEDLKWEIPASRVKDPDLIRQICRSGTLVFKYVPDAKTSPRPKIGEPMPAFTATDTEGNVYTEKSTLGHPMVINFWFTGCGPCKREMPELSSWMDKVPDATYLAVTFNSPEQIATVVKERGFKYHQITCDKQLISKFVTNGFPVTVIVDSKGIVRTIVDGTDSEKQDYLLHTLQDAANQ